ncbi:MAG: GTPase ObgE [Desulfobacterales bacterium]
MKFIDEAMITVESGSGGSGCVSFRREKYIPRGGPDGGDGGKGGDVVLRSTTRKRTLYQFRFKRQFKAQNGANGQGNRKSGKRGNDLVIEVPPGTVVMDTESGEMVKDFTDAEETFIVARGGRGGQGNSRFKSATHRAPRFAQNGESGEKRVLKLELKLLADVGIIGLPNAGKSTLISTISSAKPKIADYPFTTLIPNLGVVKTDWAEPFIVADIPGLIEGAHRGAGLGTRFLRHIERTRIILHLIDASAIDAENPLKDFQTITNELVMHNPLLAQKPQIVVLNKMDLPGTDKQADRFSSAMSGKMVFRISAATGEGVNRLLSKVVRLLDMEHG